MKKKQVYRENLIAESVKAIKKYFAGDIRENLSFNDSGMAEYWIGEKGTTTLKALNVYYTNDGDLEATFEDFGVTVQELRSDTRFMAAWLQDGDVNHCLTDVRFQRPSDPDYDTDMPQKFYDLDCQQYELQWFTDWMNQKRVEMPVTPCGLCNYCDGYVDYTQGRY